MPKTQQGQALLRSFAALQALLEHGKLRTDQLNSVVAAMQASNAKALGDTVVTCLGNLVQSRYVQRARGCDAEKPQRPLPATVKVWTPQAFEPPAPDSEVITEHSKNVDMALQRGQLSTLQQILPNLLHKT